MSTDCYAVVFADGVTAIAPIGSVAVMHGKDGWWLERIRLDEVSWGAISQVWHCPSPASAAQILRELGKGYHPEKDTYDGYVASCDVVLLCRNPAGRRCHDRANIPGNPRA